MNPRGRLLLALALVTAPAATARAEVRTVCVLAVRGPGGAAMTGDLDQALAELYATVDAGVYRYAAEEMGMAGPSPQEVAAVAHRQRIDALVSGAVSPDGAALRIAVRDGADGQVVARLEYPLAARGRLDPPTRQKVVHDLAVSFETTVGVPHGARAVRVPETPPPARPVQPEHELDEEEPPLPTRRRRAPPRHVEEPPDESPPRRRPPPEDDETPGVDEAPRPEVRRPAAVPPGHGVEVGVGFGVLTRSLHIDAPGAVGYQGGGVATVNVEAALFPFAWSARMRSRHPALATFGLEVSWLQVLPFTSTSPSGYPVASSGRAWRAALVSRIPFGSAKRPSLSIATGLGSIDFSSAQPAELGVPDVGYLHLFLRLGLDAPLGTRFVELGLSATVLAVLDGGAITSTTEYGGGSGFGGDASLGLTVRPTRWLWLRAAVRYGGVRLGFNGSGARLGSGASDDIFDGMLELGIAG